MKSNCLYLIGLTLLGFCSTHSDKEYSLTGHKCKIWKPKHWDNKHFECFDSKGQRAIYKIDKGHLVHIAQEGDIVYDWKWEIESDTTIFLAESLFKIKYLTKDSFAFAAQDGFVLSGKNLTNNFVIKKCDCADLIAFQK